MKKTIISVFVFTFIILTLNLGNISVLFDTTKVSAQEVEYIDNECPAWVGDAMQKACEIQKYGASVLTEEEYQNLISVEVPNEDEQQYISFCSTALSAPLDILNCMSNACDNNNAEEGLRIQCKLRIAGQLVRSFGAKVESGDLTSGTTSLDTKCDSENLNRGNCEIIDFILVVINVLSAAAGMAIIASIMIAGYQWMTAQDNSGQVEAARKRIGMAILALFTFIFMYAFLQWLIPGGTI